MVLPSCLADMVSQFCPSHLQWHCHCLLCCVAVLSQSHLTFCSFPLLPYAASAVTICWTVPWCYQCLSIITISWSLPFTLLLPSLSWFLMHHGVLRLPPWLLLANTITRDDCCCLFAHCSVPILLSVCSCWCWHCLTFEDKIDVWGFSVEPVKTWYITYKKMFAHLAYLGCVPN